MGIDRRRFVATTATAATAVLGLSGSVTAQATPEASPAAGPWTFVDDRGREIVLDRRPERLFCEAQAALTLDAYGIASVGMIGFGGIYDIPDHMADVPFLDLAESGGEFDVEAIAALDPDLIIGLTWNFQTLDDFGTYVEESIPGFTDVAPTLCILGVAQPMDVSVDRFKELAVALGGDVASPEATAAKVEFDGAAQAVRDAVASKPGLKVMALAPYEDSCWMGNPDVASDLLFFRNLGIEFVAPDMGDAVPEGVFHEVSWEQIGQYSTDLYMIDIRPPGLQPEALKDHPVFSLLPAAQADQFTSWNVEYVTNDAGIAPLLRTLADAIGNAEIVTG